MYNKCYVIVFCSRNKDNKDVKNFKERRKSFIIDSPDYFKYHLDFLNFVNNGVSGEMSRFYISCNARDTDKVHKALIHYLIDNPDLDLCLLDSKVASIAAKKENAAEHKWLFDFDADDYEAVCDFERDIIKCGGVIDELYATPNGYAVIVEQGFDTRELMRKWERLPLTLKRDGLICIGWERKDGIRI